MAVMPASMPARRASTASASSLPPHCQPPIAHAPKAIGGTINPERPSARGCTARSVATAALEGRARALYTRRPMSPTRKDHRAACPGPGPGGPRRELVTRPVSEVEGLDGLLESSLPAFGGAYLRRIWGLLDEAIGQGLPMTIAISGPVTVSGQHYTWLNPLLDTGWFCLLSTTDAVCYHDGHRALDGAREHPFHEVAIFGDDGSLRDERTIRVT